MNSSIIIKISSIILVISSFSVIFARNPIHSALSLVLSFVVSSIIILLFNSEFFALLFILVYSGAVIVLFLFVVMMLDLKQKTFKTNKSRLPLGFLWGFLLALKLNAEMFKSFEGFNPKTSWLNNYYFNWRVSVDTASDIKALSLLLYTYYPAQILIIGLLLYVVVLGISHLTNKKPLNLKRTQSLTRQLSRQEPIER